MRVGVLLHDRVKGSEAKGLDCSVLEWASFAAKAFLACIEGVLRVSLRSRI